jgi:hypothetical protein
VKALGKTQHRVILGVAESYANPGEEREPTMNAFVELVALLHSDFNKAEDADRACRGEVMPAISCDFLLSASEI